MEQVVISTWQTKGKGAIGHLRLNAEKSLNALNLQMAQALMAQLSEWQTDQNIVAVVIEGTGDKAFCAGGDVVAMYQAMKESPREIPEFVASFFLTEYQLDYLIHSYNKPVVVWGNGIVMGGGLGLMAGGSHRVVTETSRIAMPEITIGLYPDVGGSYFLNNMPTGCGLFLGLTGAAINATDACLTGLADFAVAAASKPELFKQLTELEWAGCSDSNHDLLNKLFVEFALNSSSLTLPASHLQPHLEQIVKLDSCEDISAAIEHIQTMSGDDAWLTKAKNNLAHGSPITAHLVFQQLARGKGMSLAEVFRMEAIMSAKCGQHGEFQEGVRALLIDKDRQPDWRYKNVQQVPQDLIDDFFVSPWQHHPLAALGA